LLNWYLLFLKVNPDAKLCPKFNLTSLLNFTILTLFNLIKMLIVMEIKINKSLLIFLLNFTKQILLQKNSRPLLLFPFIKKQNKIISKLNIKNPSYFFEKTDRSYFVNRSLLFFWKNRSFLLIQSLLNKLSYFPT